MRLNDFFRLKSTKTTFLGQIRPKPLFLAKIDQHHIVRAENRKMETAKLRPKRDKKFPFSSVLISSPGRVRGRGRGRVPVLRCKGILPVHPISKTIGGGCASGKQQATRTDNGLQSSGTKETPRWGSVAPRTGVGTPTPSHHLWS